MIKMLVAVNDKMLVAVNDKIVVAEMRQKFRIDFPSGAAITRHPPLSGDAATKNCALSPQASCAVLISKKGYNKVCVNRQSKFDGELFESTIIVSNGEYFLITG